MLTLPLGTLRRLIQEAIKQSDVNAFVKALENVAFRNNASVKGSIDTSGSMFNVFIKHVSGDEDSLEQEMTRVADEFGWVLLSKSTKRGTVWWFEPKPETKGSIPKNKVPSTLYHVTSSEFVESIMKNGLIPRSRSVKDTSRKYEPRVYLATNPKDAMAAVRTADDSVLLAIDVSNLKSRFFLDQEFGFRKDKTPVAVYTLDPIPANLITIV